MLTRFKGIPKISFAWQLSAMRKTVSQSKDFVSVRLDQELKAELLQAAELERRSLSSFCRLLLEYAWGQYLKAGSMRELLSASPHEHTKHRSSK